jgi:hypothetical protein
VSLSSATGTGLLLRPAEARFHSRLDWLDSWHSFSFGHHHDPAWMGFGPLRVINDDTIAAGRGFDLHPHRDMEIVTVMVEGELTHRDSLGHGEVLRAGEVQRMTTGTGVLHSEKNETARPCRLLQIWIQPSRPGLLPAYEQKAFEIGADWTPLLDPQCSHGAMAIQRPLRLWRARPGAAHSLSLALPAGSLGWLQLIDGGVRVGGESLKRGDGLGFRGGVAQELLTGPEGADLLFFEMLE